MKWQELDVTRGMSPLVAPKRKELNAMRGISPLVASKQKELDAMRGISPLVALKWKELDTRRGDIPSCHVKMARTRRDERDIPVGILEFGSFGVSTPHLVTLLFGSFLVYTVAIFVVTPHSLVTLHHHELVRPHLGHDFPQSPLVTSKWKELDTMRGYPLSSHRVGRNST